MAELKTGEAALAGVMVIDLTRREAGRSAAFLFAQLGATVVLVEPSAGSALRAEADALPKGEALWAAWHANQKSVAIDLDTEAGRELLRALVRKADVVIEDSAEEMTRLGLSYEQVRETRTSIIWGSLRPWASEERFNGLSSEVMLQATVGIMCQTGEPDGPPLRSGPHYVAGLSAIYLLIGVLAALRTSKRTQVGERIRVVEQEVGMSTTPGMYHEGAAFEEETRYYGRRGGLSQLLPTRPFGPNDFCYLHLNAKIYNHWIKVARAIGREDLLEDPSFGTEEGFKKNGAMIDRVLRDWFAQHTKDEVMTLLGEAGVPSGALHSIDSTLEIEGVRTSGAFTSLETADGPALVPNSPIRLSASPVPLRRGPRLGEHTADILRELG